MLDLKLSISEVNQIYNELNSISGFDFKDYAFSFKMRKIMSLMNAANIFSVDDFIYRLHNSENAVIEFVKSLFVAHSELFRNAEFWDYLQEKILAKLLLKNEVKIHIPYCVNGEELYTLIYFLGFYKSDKISIFVSHPLKENEKIIKERIFTEKDLKACRKNIELLRSVRNTEDVFLGHTNQLKINHYYRGKIIFENIITKKQQHISEFDLVLFRNRMIYYKEILKEEILKKIYASLKKGGFLIIGEKETLGNMSGKFKKLQTNLSAYKKKIF